MKKQEGECPPASCLLPRYNGAKVDFTILFDFKVRDMGELT
jgi:hypothetical protein